VKVKFGKIGKKLLKGSSKAIMDTYKDIKATGFKGKRITVFNKKLQKRINRIDVRRLT